MSEEEAVPAVETETPAPAPAPAPAAELEAGSTENLFSGAPTDAAAPAEPVFEPVLRGKLDKFGVAMGTGRGKTSVARVRIKPGSGQFSINGRTLEDFCCVEKHRETVMAPLKAADVVGKYDIWVRVEGGGITGQAGAMLLGISRALEVLNPSLHHMLSDSGFLTRDGRKVERKKYGFKKARRSFQFSKR